MDLKSRLAQLQRQAGSDPPPQAPAQATATAALRARLQRLRPERVQPRPAGRDALSADDLARALAGELIAPGVIRIRHTVPLVSPGGESGPETASPGIPASLRGHPEPLADAARLPGEAAAEGGRSLYLDTETTGLSGGSGTLAFLLGIVVATGEALQLTQFLLTRFAAEAAMLAAAAQDVRTSDRLLSYNGKSYDLPLLAARFRMQGLDDPFAALPHLDLLHPVRRLFGKHWPDCRLLTLEQRLLGFTRRDDLPGSEAPAAWFDYLRRGDSERLLRVVAHNRQDLLSLAAAHGALARAVREPPAGEIDLAALARWLAESDPEAARALLLAHQAGLCDAGKRLLARLLRRAGHWRQAVTVWEALAAGGCTESLEHLAKYHEHVSRDLAAAQRCCERLPGGPALQQRRARIERKLQARGTGRELW